MSGGTEAGSGPAAAAMDRALCLRIVEAVLFASAEPVEEVALRQRLPADADLGELLGELADHYRWRGVTLERVGRGWAFRTAPDLAPYLRAHATERRALSRPAVETLAVIAYHQPVTRAEIEAIRGVSVSRGTLDILLEAGWLRPLGRRETPGRPLTWGTTPAFLDHFGLGDLRDLPGIEELRAAGLLGPETETTVLATGERAAGQPGGGAGGDGRAAGETVLELPLERAAARRPPMEPAGE